ncbi:MAG: hypothetical protein GQ564_12080 [Bacteroidales bacterium]|nr:hypothetical protein [Bacteroidales bacterium]
MSVLSSVLDNNNNSFINANSNSINEQTFQKAAERVRKGFSQREQELFEHAKKNVLTKESIEENLNKAYRTVHGKDCK